jgi:rRNA-processing protein FCF1
LRKVIFDSSFLMAVAERPTDWLGDITDALGRVEPVILECAKAELEGLSAGGGKKVKLARLALELARGFSVEPCGGANVDDEVVSHALREGAAVATVDRGMMESLRELRVDVVGLRSGRVVLR